jgi:Tellurite resistance protein TerB.
MSDSLGMKAVNRVEETDRLPFLKTLAYIAAADDSVTVDEKEMVDNYTEAWNLDDAAQDQVRDILEPDSSLSLNQLVAEFSESGTRFLLMQELMRLSYADGTYGDVERKEIATIAKRMGMSEAQFREVEKWVGRGQAWEASAGDGPEDDQFQDAISGEDPENDYELRDIETGGSDLSDIDPGEHDPDEDALDDEDEPGNEDGDKN